MFKALVIPVDGPVTELELGHKDGDLSVLQEAVGGLIQALPVPVFIAPKGNATVYVNEEGKFDPERFPFNPRATDFLVPGLGLFKDDYISGTMVVAGFKPRYGTHGPLPHSCEDRVRKIEQEAGR